ncbi:hypothetical protein TKK_0013726 [Trichogramma kaykai]
MTVIQEAQEWSVDEEGNIHMLEKNINSEIPSTSSANETQERNDDFNQQVSSNSVSSHNNIPLIILDFDEEESAGDIHREIKPIHPFFGPLRRVTPQRPRILSDVMLKTAKIRPLRVADTRMSARTRPYTRRNSNPVVEPNESPDIFGNLSNLANKSNNNKKTNSKGIVKIISPSEKEITAEEIEEILAPSEDADEPENNIEAQPIQTLSKISINKILNAVQNAIDEAMSEDPILTRSMLFKHQCEVAMSTYRELQKDYMRRAKQSRLSDFFVKK